MSFNAENNGSQHTEQSPMELDLVRLCPTVNKHSQNAAEST